MPKIFKLTSQTECEYCGAPLFPGQEVRSYGKNRIHCRRHHNQGLSDTNLPSKEAHRKAYEEFCAQQTQYKALGVPLSRLRQKQLLEELQFRGYNIQSIHEVAAQPHLLQLPDAVVCEIDEPIPPPPRIPRVRAPPLTGLSKRLQRSLATAAHGRPTAGIEAEVFRGQLVVFAKYPSNTLNRTVTTRGFMTASPGVRYSVELKYSEEVTPMTTSSHCTFRETDDGLVLSVPAFSRTALLTQSSLLGSAQGTLPLHPGVSIHFVASFQRDSFYDSLTETMAIDAAMFSVRLCDSTYDRWRKAAEKIPFDVL